jgi:mannose-6-phosphate isomerase-like protein (cupin superfamily)
VTYVRPVDTPRLLASAERFRQSLHDRDDGAISSKIYCVSLPPGVSSEGLHTHAVEQCFYVLTGTLSVEIDGDHYEAGPGTLVVTPPGVPHRNWNASNERTTFLGIMGLPAAPLAAVDDATPKAT